MLVRRRDKTLLFLAVPIVTDGCAPIRPSLSFDQQFCGRRQSFVLWFVFGCPLDANVTQIQPGTIHMKIDPGRFFSGLFTSCCVMLRAP